MTGRIEVVARVSGRQYWTVEQKLGMLRDAFGAGGSVARGDRAARDFERVVLHMAQAGDVGRVDRDCACRSVAGFCRGPDRRTSGADCSFAAAAVARCIGPDQHRVTARPR
jgi:hypothetical protein